MDVKLFNEAIDGIANIKGISHEAVVNALKDALERAYIKYLGGGDDAMVEANIDEENGFITLAQKKIVKTEVEDDYLEISPEDAKEDAKDTIEHLEENLAEAKKDEKAEIKNLINLVKGEEGSIQEGETYSLYCPLNELTKLTAMTVRSLLKQKLAEAERVALYDIYKDHIGEMVTGIVEKADDRSAFLDIGRTTVELSRREMIGDEYFRVGDNVKVYLQEVKQVGEHAPKTSKGPQIMVTRASEGFLKRLFEEEIHEVYDGTVIIKGVAREAGVRSKVAVTSNNDDVDPTGACIGPGGSRIQKVVSQLGNGKEKEKIDIIAWSNNPCLYIAEALRPAHVLGVKIIDENALPHPTALAVVKDDDFSLAIGKKGANARLANKLTGYTIDIKEEADALAEGLDYIPYETLQKQVEEEKKAKEKALYAEKSLADAKKRAAEKEETKEETAPVMPEMSAEEEEEFSDIDVNKVVSEPIKEETSAITEEAPIKEEVKPVVSEEPIKEEVVTKPVEKPVEVKTTTTLESLERDLLESSKKKEQASKGKWSKAKRPHQISEKEVARVAPNELPKEAMPIYSEEELAQIAKEEEENEGYDYDDVDLEEYDNDKYYDDN